MWPISCSLAPTDAGVRLQFEPPSAPAVGELSLNFCWKAFFSPSSAPWADCLPPGGALIFSACSDRRTFHASAKLPSMLLFGPSRLGRRGWAKSFFLYFRGYNERG